MPELEVRFLAEDELEALRLCDAEGFDQAGAGEQMGVSRGTVQRLLKTGRATLVRAVVENAALVIGPQEGAPPAGDGGGAGGDSVSQAEEGKRT
jgi:predicted DNA-binding protein (UPF0251 family)